MNAPLVASRVPVKGLEALTAERDAAYENGYEAGYDAGASDAAASYTNLDEVKF